MDEIGNADRHEVGRRLKNRAENSHPPFRRRERTMQRFRSMKTLQNGIAISCAASICRRGKDILSVARRM
jgi:putative transposase